MLTQTRLLRLFLCTGSANDNAASFGRHRCPRDYLGAHDASRQLNNADRNTMTLPKASPTALKAPPTASAAPLGCL